LIWLLSLSVAESFGSHPVVCSLCTTAVTVDVGIPLELFCRDQTVISGIISGPAYFARLLSLSVAESFGSHPVCSLCTVTVDVGIPLELFGRDQTVISGIMHLGTGLFCYLNNGSGVFGKVIKIAMRESSGFSRL
jgi:hypothetical protein